MPALARLPAPQGIAAMQSINVAAITPSFMAALFGTRLACLVVVLASLLTADAASAEGARLWASYLRSWTAWNHVRAAAALGAAALLALALS
jgi:uncharacterized membrane protein